MINKTSMVLVIRHIIKFFISSALECFIFQATDLTPMRYCLETNVSDEQKSVIWMRQATLIFCICMLIFLLGHIPIVLICLGSGSFVGSIFCRYKHLYLNRSITSFKGFSLIEQSKSIQNGNPPEYLKPDNCKEFLVAAFANVFANSRELCYDLNTCQDCQVNLPNACWEDQALSLILKWLKLRSRQLSLDPIVYVPLDCPLRFYRRIIDVMSFRLRKTPATKVFTHDFLARFTALKEMANNPVTSIREFLIKITTLLEADRLDSQMRWEYLRLYSDLSWIISCRGDLIIAGFFHCQFLITWNCDGCGNHGIKTVDADTLELDWSTSQPIDNHGVRICRVQLSPGVIRRYAVPGGCANCTKPKPIGRLSHNPSIQVYLAQVPMIITVPFPGSYPPASFIEIKDHTLSNEPIILRLQSAIFIKDNESMHFALAIDNCSTWTVNQLGHCKTHKHPIDHFLRVNGGDGRLLFFMSGDHF